MNAAACRGARRLLVRRHRLARPDRRARRRLPPALGRRGAAHRLQRAQGRGVTDLEPLGGGFVETVVVGPRRERADGAGPRRRSRRSRALLHRIAGGAFAERPVRAAPPRPTAAASCWRSTPTDGSVWAVGGGAASGPTAPRGAAASSRGRRSRVAARRRGRSASSRSTGATFGAADRFEDVAAVPGHGDGVGRARAVRRARPHEREGAGRADRRRDRRDDGRAAARRRARAAAPRRGSRSPSPTDGWLVTTAGWLFHYTDGTPLPAGHRPGVRRRRSRSARTRPPSSSCPTRRRPTTRSCSRRRRSTVEPEPTDAAGAPSGCRR